MLPFFKSTNMLKIYRIKRPSASVLVYVSGRPTRVEFTGGCYQTSFHGQCTVENEQLQQAIEGDYRFGEEIYLHMTYGTEEVKEEVKEEKKEVTPEKKEPQTMTYAQAKEYLIGKGLSTDQLKNYPMVKSEAKKFGIELK